MTNKRLPVIVPDRLLISPGIWNDNEYSAKEISDGFTKTDWGDKEKISLWLNHDDRNASAFVGYVRNPRLETEGRVFGDLEIWDEQTARILTEAMAKFGVSAKIAGKEDEKTGKMSDFSFENFSIVTTPACSDAYINLSKKEDDTVSKYLISSDKVEAENISVKEPDSNSDVRRLKEMGEEEKKEEVVEEVKEEVEEVKENSEKELLEKLNSKFDKLIELLSKKELEEESAGVENEEPEKAEEPADEPEEKADEELSKEPVEENKELIEVKKELAELKEKLNKPKSKTMKTLSSNTVGNDVKYNSDVFCDFLESVDSPMKIV